jgi:hypothetical protein
MFDFDVVTGPGDVAKRTAARRKHDLPRGADAPQTQTSEEMKRQSAGDSDQPQPHRE